MGEREREEERSRLGEGERWEGPEGDSRCEAARRRVAMAARRVVEGGLGVEGPRGEGWERDAEGEWRRGDDMAL